MVGVFEAQFLSAAPSSSSSSTSLVFAEGPRFSGSAPSAHQPFAAVSLPPGSLISGPGFGHQGFSTVCPFPFICLDRFFCRRFSSLLCANSFLSGESRLRWPRTASHRLSCLVCRRSSSSLLPCGCPAQLPALNGPFLLWFLVLVARYASSVLSCPYCPVALRHHSRCCS